MKYKHTRLESADRKPLATDIETAEIAINLVDGLLYTKNASGTVIPIGGSGSGGGGADDSIFYRNNQTIIQDYTLVANQNAMTAGPISVDAGVTVTVEAGATWTVVGGN